EPVHEHVLLLIGRAAARRRWLAGLVFARQHALRQRRPHHLPDPRAAAQRQHLLFDLPRQQRILRLAPFWLVVAIAADLQTLLDSLDRPFRESPTKNLALPEQIVHRPHGLIQSRAL